MAQPNQKGPVTPIKATRGPTWSKVSELQRAIQDAYEQLLADGDAELARAKFSGLKTLSKLIDARLEHARMTNRLKSGSDALPDFKLEE